MVTFVLGPSGSGKTCWLIAQANEERKKGNGNIVFIDSDDKHIFSLDHGVRLIDASDFRIHNVDQLCGFLAGIVSRDFDVEKIYVDGIYDIVNVDTELEKMVQALNELTDEHHVEILMGMNKSVTELPEGLKVKTVELSAVEA